MTGARGTSQSVLSALAPFSYDWIGGNIAGLASFAVRLEFYVPEIGEVVTGLDQQVAQIASDAGWQGRAASAFAKAWEVDAVGATALATVINSTAQTCGQLASALATIEHALETFARQVEAHGVQIGGNGQPVPEPLTATAETWRQAYLSYYDECMADATTARINATTALHGLYAQIAPPAKAGGGSGGLQLGDDNTLGDYLRAFWALPTEYRKEVQESVETQEGLVAKAEKALAGDRDALGRFTAGNKIKVHLAALEEAEGKLKPLEKELDTAKASENALTKGLDFSVADIPAFSDKDLSKVLGAAADTPFIDILSGGLGAYLGAQQDIQNHVNPVVAYGAETDGAALSFAGAGAVAESIAGPLAVRLGVAGIVGWGIGDLAHNVIDEPWGQDFGHQDVHIEYGQPVVLGDPIPGYYDGLNKGIDDVLRNTGSDAVNLVKSTVVSTRQEAVGLWHVADGLVLQPVGNEFQSAANTLRSTLNPMSW
jgi:uncharacterized protein YukE